MPYDLAERPLLIFTCPGCGEPMTGKLPIKLTRDEHDQVAALIGCARCRDGVLYAVMIGTLVAEADAIAALAPPPLTANALEAPRA